MIRPVQQSDLDIIKSDLIDANELFPSEMLNDMIAPFFLKQQKDDKGDESSWFTEICATENRPVSIVYCTPENLTEGTYNALLLAVAKDRQGEELGTRLMQNLEKYLKEEKNARLLLVETSGTDEYAKTRAFYERRLGYEQEARIRDYYTEGDDKIVFRKKLN